MRILGSGSEEVARAIVGSIVVIGCDKVTAFAGASRVEAVAVVTEVWISAMVLEGGRVCDGEGNGRWAAGKNKGKNMGAAWTNLCSAGSQ